MRFAAGCIGLILFAGSAYAQAPPCSWPTLGYDPYRPSELAIMREYGGTMLAQAPLSALLKLDPYVPSQGELLRQLGRGIPLWALYPGYPPPPIAKVPACQPAREPSPPAPTPLTTFAEMWSALERERGTAALVAPHTTIGAVPAERSRGISIQYAGRTWVSAGLAVPFRNTAFERVGESAGFSIFQRTGAKNGLIFVPTTPGMVAPFRAIP